MEPDSHEREASNAADDRCRELAGSPRDGLTEHRDDRAGDRVARCAVTHDANHTLSCDRAREHSGDEQANGE